MKFKMLFGLLLSLMTLAMFGCGDDNGGTSTRVSGSAVAGAISGGTVTFNSIDAAGVVGAVIPSNPTPVTTAADGTYTATIGYAGPLLVTVTGGTYIDEATGQSVALATPLRAAIPNAAGTVAGNVTPFTELAVQEAGTLTVANITSANAAISSMINVPDILVTSPADPAYEVPLQTLSQVQVDTAADLATTIANLGAGITVDPATSTATIDPATQAVIDTATTNIATNPNIQPTAVTLTAAPTTGVINTQGVTITAAVTFVSSGQPVPAGATVNFAITSGTGTLSAASAVTAAGGSATVTLSSTEIASVVVSAATASSAAATITVPFISDPNVPGGISIVANPTSLFAGQGTSTITATVTPAGQGGVVPNGTVVTFATSAGTITASATTTGGVATATLTPPATAGTATITATVNGINSTPVNVVINALPVQAVVKLAISGTLPAGTTIDGAQFILNYVTTKGLSIVDTPAAIAASGGAVANLIINNVGVNGVVNSAFANANASPIATQTGEFATLTFTITGATPPFPALADFTIASSTVSTTPVLATPLTVTVLSVTLL